MTRKVSKITEAPIYPQAQPGTPIPKDESITLAGMLAVAEAWVGDRPRRMPFTGTILAPEVVTNQVKRMLVEWQRDQGRRAHGSRAASGQPAPPTRSPADPSDKSPDETFGG